MTRESIDLDELDIPEIITRAPASSKQPFLPFQADTAQAVPGFLPVGNGVLVRQTSSTHGPDGYITTDPDEIARSQERLSAKLLSAVDQFAFHETFSAHESDTLVISYGVSARAAKAVFKEQQRQGKPVSLFVLKTLWPVPEHLIQQVARPVKRVVVVEMNMGQYVREIERILPQKRIDFLGQMDGRLITPAQIKEVIARE